MRPVNRRHFLSSVGCGMLVGAVGTVGIEQFSFGDTSLLAPELDRLSFGPIDPLVDMMQLIPPEKLLPQLVEKMKSGLDLKTMTAAAALANARRFGGEDYIGYHTFMALAPAFAMSMRMPRNQAALPVLKVIYRNAERIQADGGGEHDHLHALDYAADSVSTTDEQALRSLILERNKDAAEGELARLVDRTVGEAFNHLQFAIQDEIDVHRVVLPWRAWSTLDIVGSEHALTLLRQSVRFCIDAENYRVNNGRGPSELRTLLPMLIDENKLLEKETGDRILNDDELQKLSDSIYGPSREQAARAVAAALSEGVSTDSIAEAISLASCQLVLHDPGRKTAEPGKPVGSIHGASVGVHASDSANAWRHIASVCNNRNRVASLIAGAFHTAGQSQRLNEVGWPLDEHLRPIEERDPTRLLDQLDGAIRENNQQRATAIVHRYGEAGGASKDVFDRFLRFAASEDGELHAEKYFWTVAEEFEFARESTRWQHLCALARVTASEFGTRSKGYDLAQDLLRGV